MLSEPPSRIETQLDAHVEDPLDLCVQHVPRQPVLRNPVAHHPARRGARLVHGDLVPEAPQVVGGR